MLRCPSRETLVLLRGGVNVCRPVRFFPCRSTFGMTDAELCPQCGKLSAAGEAIENREKHEGGPKIRSPFGYGVALTVKRRDQNSGVGPGRSSSDSPATVIEVVPVGVEKTQPFTEI